MKHLIFILLISNLTYAKRCQLRPKTSSIEIQLIFPNITLHSDEFKDCALLQKVHNYRRELGILSVLLDYKLKSAYIDEVIE